MDRKQFMEELESLLMDISEEEREEALEFYENYFDEAGRDHEKEVIEKLGSPSQVAEMIKEGLKNHFDEHIEGGDHGFSHNHMKNEYELKRKKRKQKDVFSQWKDKWNQMDSRDRLILIVILLLCIVPLSFPIFGMFTGLFAFGMSITIPLAIFFFGFAIVTFFLYVLAIIMIVGGVLQLFVFPATGLIVLGIGCILVAIAKVFGKITSWFFKTFIPQLIDRLTDLFNKVFNRGVHYEN